MKRFGQLEKIAERVIRKSLKEGQSFALRVDRPIDCQQGEEKGSFRRFVKVVIGIIILAHPRRPRFIYTRLKINKNKSLHKFPFP